MATEKGGARVSDLRGQFHIFTSESVSEGHPDKICDFIADSILDAYIAKDPESHVACEVLAKSNRIVIAGEISSRAGRLDHAAIAREAVRSVGYVNSDEPFNADGVEIEEFVTQQADEIAAGVDARRNAHHDQGAGDQGIMFGYATNESPEMMPLPILLAHRLVRGLAEDRKSGRQPWLRPDAKSQVSVAYEGHSPLRVTGVLVSTLHAPGTNQETILEYVKKDLTPRVLDGWFHPEINYKVNPAGKWEQGGPSADCGVTGRKIIVDTYGGAARHGGGAFSGKDPSKVDRSGAYFCRFVARQTVKEGLATRAEIQVSYAIGDPKPFSILVDTFGTGDPKKAEEFVHGFDFRPRAMIERLDLLRPIYRSTTNYGHYGKPELPWES
jgi:S-adenosylmethionine synthetase